MCTPHSLLCILCLYSSLLLPSLLPSSFFFFFISSIFSCPLIPSINPLSQSSFHYPLSKLLLSVPSPLPSHSPPFILSSFPAHRPPLPPHYSSHHTPPHPPVSTHFCFLSHLFSLTSCPFSSQCTIPDSTFVLHWLLHTPSHCAPYQSRHPHPFVLLAPFQCIPQRTLRRNSDSSENFNLRVFAKVSTFSPPLPIHSVLLWSLPGSTFSALPAN